MTVPLPTTASANSTSRVVVATRPLLRLSRPNEGQYIWLNKGREGSLQTAVEMAKLVRHDAVSDEGLERFAVQKLIDARLDSHSRPEDVIEVLFRFVQRLPYIYDPAGSFDSVQSARHTLAKGYGDCDDLATLLATLLALVGYKPRFVLARYKPETKGFDHVYVDVALANGSRIALDPCARSHGMGWENSRSIERLTFPIFAGRVSSFGFVAPAAAAGAAFSPVTMGLSLVPMLIGPIINLFSRRQQRAEETQRDEWKNQVQAGMVEIQRAVDSCKLSSSEGVAAAKQLVSEFYKGCDSFSKSSVAQSCRNFETQDVPGGAQEGSFVTHTARIANAGGNCAVAAAASQPGISQSGSVSILNGGANNILGGATGVNWTMLLLIAGGVFLLTRMR